MRPRARCYIPSQRNLNQIFMFLNFLIPKARAIITSRTRTFYVSITFGSLVFLKTFWTDAQFVLIQPTKRWRCLTVKSLRTTLAEGCPIKEKIIFRDIIGINSIALLPIALAYHIAHYLTSFLVDIQYFYKVLSDPLNLGMDLINIGQFNVTTSFFNTIETVKLIWFIQASAIVIGHVIAVLLAHSISENYLKTKSSVLILSVTSKDIIPPNPFICFDAIS